jgi:hypothetical protein
VSAPDPHHTWPTTWQATRLAKPPLIAPARQFTYPLEIAGEEDALARGAMLLDVRPRGAPAFLATCALGYTDPSMPSGVWACPRPQELCAVAGGYAYLIDTAEPSRSTHIALRPVAHVAVALADTQLPTGLLLFVGFHTVVAWGESGLVWTTGRLSWEGITLGEQRDGMLHGTGWHMPRDKELPFAIDLRTGEHTGGGFTP